MKEHLYMYSGGSITAKFRAEKIILDDLIDWFSTDIGIIDEDEKHIIVTARVNQTAMYKWAIQYCEHVEVLEPRELREKVTSALKSAANKYT
ncbi:MAG: WYL domain-containing protein [Firmicutes bacterium]|nr:WYL domain-containing protein [Bacillota bacterium]